jgi:plastocyanin
VFLIASGCAGKEKGPAPEGSNKSASEASTPDQKESGISGTGEVHTVLLRYPAKVMVPPELDIKTGDTVAWRSDKNQKPYYILVSKEGLFPDEELNYHVSYNYTFSSPGTYQFTVKDIPEMNITVTVK